MGRITRAAALAALALTATAGQAGAATINVTTTDDPGEGSLRAAITTANTLAGADTIEFDIAGNGTKKITIHSPLPAVTGPVTIDGYSQTDAVANTEAGFTSAFAAGGAGSNATIKVELDLNDNPGLV